MLDFFIGISITYIFLLLMNVLNNRTSPANPPYSLAIISELVIILHSHIFDNPVPYRYYQGNA